MDIHPQSPSQRECTIYMPDLQVWRAETEEPLGSKRLCLGISLGSCRSYRQFRDPSSLRAGRERPARSGDQNV
jgi:hypothetical protein